MKLLFLENRHKTYLFQAIANKLSAEGHDIHWIIQNRVFIPQGNFKNHIIKYPKSGKINGFTKDETVEEVIRSDRQVNHFKKKDTSYFYYYNDKIKKLLEAIKPNLVFGESTAFHELLAINNCKSLKILYLNPSTCRYPVGRFSFYKYDTLEPYLGSNEKLSNEKALEVINSIVHRKTLPDYMKPVKTGTLHKVKDKLKKVYAYYDGERYNTPNPLIKRNIEKQRVVKIKKWDDISVNNLEDDGAFKVLYPLQMQPEANIDVWGKKYRDQSKLIHNISKSLPEGATLYVKPNPKSKYELNDSLYLLVKEKENIIVLNHSTKMDEVLKRVDLVITVTGTVAIECILTNKPVVNLIKTVNNQAKNCIFIEELNELHKIIESIKTNSFPKLNEQEKIDFINILNSTSYKGIISDPFSDMSCVKSLNITDVIAAFKNVIKS